MTSQFTVHPFFCPSTKSPSFKMLISYPQIPNISYNFELKLQVFLQTLLQRMSYNLVHEQTFLIPKKQIIIQHLEPSKMYKIVILWTKKGISAKDNIEQEKTVFACSEKMPDDQGDKVNDLEEQVQDEAYDRFVKGNIKNYFDQYYHDKSQFHSKKSSLSSNKNASSISSFQQKASSSRKKPQKVTEKTPFCNSELLIKVIGQSDPFISKKNLEKYILEGRKSTSVKDYLTTKDFQCFDSFNKLYKNQTQRRKHVEKTLLVSKAMNMLSEIYAFEKEHGVLTQTGFTNNNKRNEQKQGKQFFKNDWFMGPFYSYDANEKQMKKRESINYEGEDHE